MASTDHDENTNKDIITTTPPPPKLPLFSLPPLQTMEYTGSMTPPPYTLQASVPFRWEEHPGKPFPFPCTSVEGDDTLDAKCLELPPRLLNAEAKTTTKSSSPTTVLEGPYPSRRLSKSILESSSFRFLKKRQHGVSLFDGSVSFAASSRGNSPDRGLLGAVVVSGNISKRSEMGLFGSWRKKGGISFKKTSEVHGDNFAFSNSYHGGCRGGATVEVAPISRKRNRLSLSLAKPHFWETIYSAFKQVIPRRSTKWKKDTL